MPINAINSDTTVEKLVTRLFGRLPAARLRTVIEATLAANPHLGNASDVPAGTIVVVPQLDVADPPSVREEARISDQQVRDITGALADYAKQIVGQLDQHANSLAGDAKMLGSAQFKRDLAGVDDAVPLLPDLAATLNSEQREVTERRELLTKDASSLTEALAALARHLE